MHKPSHHSLAADISSSEKKAEGSILFSAIEGHSVPAHDITEFFPKKTRYCVVIVQQNEGDKFRAQLARMLPKAPEADIIIADGASTDHSVEREYLKAHKVRALCTIHETTAGHGYASQFRIALAYAVNEGYEGIIMIDGNNKDGVDAISDFIAALDEGYDFVQGSRFMKGGVHKNTPFDRYVGIRFFHAPLMRLVTGFHFTDSFNGFRAFSMKFLMDEKVLPFRDIFRKYDLQFYLIYRATSLGFKSKEIPVSRCYPDDGTVPSKIKGLKSRMALLIETFYTITGRYNPR